MLISHPGICPVSTKLPFSSTRPHVETRGRQLLRDVSRSRDAACLPADHGIATVSTPCPDSKISPSGSLSIFQGPNQPRSQVQGPRPAQILVQTTARPAHSRFDAAGGRSGARDRSGRRGIASYLFRSHWGVSASCTAQTGHSFHRLLSRGRCRRGCPQTGPCRAIGGGFPIWRTEFWFVPIHLPERFSL